MARHRAQLLELLQNYGPIDQLCLDMWLGHAVWPQLRETVKLIRKASPKTMFRARGIANYGDYHTPEQFVPGAPANTAMPWMCIYPLGNWFSYERAAGYYKGSRWMISNISDCAAKGAAFMVGIGPDGDGRFHPEAERQLLEVGEWLRANGAAVYDTGPRPSGGWGEGENVRFTAADDGSATYVHLLRDPGPRLTLRTVRPSPGARAHLLSGAKPLAWSFEEPDYLTVELPDSLPDQVNIIRIDGKA
jgi:alpha-L-fucosidase